MSAPTTTRPTVEQQDGAGTRRTTVLIIGGGFSGIGLAHRLRRAGVEDLVVLERSSDPGGVWQANTFPGATCDVPSNLYSFSFAPNPEWSSTYSPQAEIRTYLHDCVERFGLRPTIRAGVEVLGARWDEGEDLWHVQTSDGEWRTRVLVSAVGPLTEPRLPDVPGIERFTGEVMHSARWDAGYDLAGKRVASIGTGASAIQYVPRIAEVAGHLSVFQRTPPWVMPHDKRPVTDAERERYRRHPLLQRADRARTYLSKEALVLGFVKRPSLMDVVEKIAVKHLREQVADPELRRELSPEYTVGCKRIVPSNEWYPALQRENVTVVPHALAEVRERSVVDSTGAEHEVDAIVFGTGFRVTEIPFADRVTGAAGRTLAEVWAGGPRAYLGTSVPGFPNYFMMLGPNTGSGHTSMVYMIEAQIAHVVKAVRAMDRAGAATIEVDRETYEAFNADVDRRLATTVWEVGGCTSFYRDATGRNATLWPDWSWRFSRAARRWRRGAYHLGGGDRRWVGAGAAPGSSTASTSGATLAGADAGSR